VNGAGTNDHQKTLVFTIQDFFNPTAGGRNMFRDGGGNRMPCASSAGVTRLSMRSAEFIGFVHGIVSENFCFIGRLPGSDGHHNITLILPGGDMITKNLNQCTSILVHAAIQSHDVEDFGSNFFYRIVGAVQPRDLVFSVQRFHFRDFHPALAQRGVAAVLTALFADGRQALRVDRQAEQLMLQRLQEAGSTRLSISSAIKG
jgi:hypothetical protein